MTYAALYCRLSPRDDANSEGVDAQERWGRDYAAKHWPELPVKVFSDRLLSAANGGPRPGFEALRAAVEAGEVAALWAVEQSRLERTEVGWFEFAAVLDTAGLAELHTNRDGVVRVRDEVAGIKAVLAAGEVRKMKKRQADTLADIAARGEPPGSRPFGYQHAVRVDGVRTYEVVEEQAEVIREVADKVLSGWSLSNIARVLRERGVVGGHRVKVRDADGEVVKESGQPVTRPSTITASAVRQMVTNPSVAGRRVHQGRDVGAGNWPAILDEATWKACRDKLGAPRTVDRVDGGTYPVPVLPAGRTVRRYLLTGVIVCGVCGASLAGAMKQMKNGGKKPYYYCTPTRGGRCCTGILAEPVEEHVADTLFAELDKPAFQAAMAVDEHATRRDALGNALDSLDRQREELAGMWADPAARLTTAEWRSARAGLDAQEHKLRQDLAELPPPVTQVAPAEVRESWPWMTLDERRELVTLFVARVTLARARPPYNRINLDRISIEWRER